MAEINILHYQPGTSVLHRLDPRLRILLLAVYITVLFSHTSLSLAVFPLFLLRASLSAGLRWRFYRRELRVFGFLGMIVFFTRAAAYFSQGPWAVILHGGLPAGIFLLVVWMGILFAALTDPDELYSVVRWLLEPIPGIPAGRIAARTGMTLVLLPLFLDTVHEIREARKARGIELRRNPAVWICSMVNPLMEKVLIHMEEFSLALEARCFDENVTRRELPYDTGQLPYALLFLTPPLFVLILSIFI
jgi:energy-coupling factor transporter transmembrane protein EcfT